MDNEKEYNIAGRPTIVLGAPAKANSYYRIVWKDVVQFLGRYASAIVAHGKDNVLILGDAASLALLRRESPSLPPDVLLGASLEDIWMRDFTAARMSAPVAFTYAPKYLAKAERTATQEAFRNFLKGHGISIPRSELVVDGGNIVDNDVDKAILTERVFKDNPDAGKEALKAELCRALGYAKVAIITEEPGDTTGHSDGMVSFINTNVVAMSNLGQIHSSVKKQLLDQFTGIEIVELGGDYKEETWRGFSSACGLHVNTLATQSTLYVPTFGGDPKNPRQSPALDERVLGQIRAATTKVVVAIPVPHSVCRMGGCVRCLSWQVKGPVADTLIQIAKSSCSS